MLFAELVHAIHPYLMKDGDVPAFMRDLIQRICSIPEEDWYTKRDPSAKEKYADGSLRKFYTNGVSKKLAKAMLGRLTRPNFVESLDYVNDDENDSADVLKDSLAKAIAPFTDEEVDIDNVGDILFDLIQKSLEFIVNPELENDRKMAQAKAASSKAKASYGSKLLEECQHTCSRPSCDHHLQTVTPGHQSMDNYEVAKISGDGANYKNLIALCHDCFCRYTLKHTKTEEKELQKIKALQSQIGDARQILRVDIERGIRKVIENLSRAKTTDFEQLSYEPVAVEKKINRQSNTFLFNTVVFNVTLYYRFVENNMKKMSKVKAFNDDLLRAQIKASYR